MQCASARKYEFYIKRTSGDWEAGTSESGFLKFEKWKVKKKSFHSFSRSAKWKKNAFTLFREVQSEKQMLSLFFEKWKVKSKCFEIEIEKWKFSRILNNSRETRFLNRLKPACEETWRRTRWRSSQLSMKTRRRRPVSSSMYKRQAAFTNNDQYYEQRLIFINIFPTTVTSMSLVNILPFQIKVFSSDLRWSMQHICNSGG